MNKFECIVYCTFWLSLAAIIITHCICRTVGIINLRKTETKEVPDEKD